MKIHSSSTENELFEYFASKSPFSSIPSDALRFLVSNSTFRKFDPGQRILRPDEVNPYIYIVVEGDVRVLSHSQDGSKTLTVQSRDSLHGWISLLRAAPSELVQAKTHTTAIQLSSELFITLYKQNPEFAKYFDSFLCESEISVVYEAIKDSYPKNFADLSLDISTCLEGSKVYTSSSLSELSGLASDENSSDSLWYMSSYGVKGFPVGSVITPAINKAESKLLLPIRVVSLRPVSSSELSETANAIPIISSSEDLPELSDYYKLGIVEDENIPDSDRYPAETGSGPINEVIAICHTVSLHQRVPFRHDTVQKIVESRLLRNKSITLQVYAGLCEVLGMKCQLAKTDKSYIPNIEAPAVFFVDGTPIVFFEVKNDFVIYTHPQKGLQKLALSEFIQFLDDDVTFILPRRVASTPTTRFSWSWFVPLLKKYKKSLVIVFASSLLAQLFGLAIPLLIQQIIDKVLSQGNLSSLNVLGTAMIVLALFQGLLQVLRTYIFVDTTDRMDLALGSSVIDRLLSLPLSFFEKRPVGELSQRLGELNSIRGFLTGTALISVLNIIFATLYIVVMFIYSPLLSVVALSTTPLYLLLVFVVAPIYKSLIRKRAVASARTQSHLIEVLGGIQTVKAQHFELTARWKWQERYRVFVDEGFKSVALGTASGEVGTFLNQLSSLLILWVGMILVLDSKLTLGQLIAFRIIAGNVTGPLLQLAGLYQGFQKVQLSMERLSDIVDQNPELLSASESTQIPLPAIKGAVTFKDVSFRFKDSGPLQLENVNIDIKAGSFVGIVGQSGSGKSTLMKLLPRLYNIEKGAVYIDSYDVSKVELGSIRRQVGIVPQDSLLFEGTVADNISMNEPNSSTEAIIQAAKIACAHEFIMSLPDGYATALSERGSNLSGGQRQRIAIARTILSDPQLLVMDEATSALDFDTERRLCLNLQNWSTGRTVFFITHRLSTVKSSDLILVMHQGRLEESGTHSELIQKNARYAALYKQQSLGS